MTHATVQLLGTGNTILWQTSVVVDSQGVAAITFPHDLDDEVEIQDYEDETVVTKAVHVSADQPVVVYGLDHRPFTTDGYLALPPSSWGTHYFIASYPGLSVQSEYQTIKATSEFALVSAYDNTIVKIALTVPTTSATGAQSHNAGDVFSVTLNKGQVYQVQAMKIANGVNQADLSMTEITSSQPVGVSAGDKCTDVPV